MKIVIPCLSANPDQWIRSTSPTKESVVDHLASFKKLAITEKRNYFGSNNKNQNLVKLPPLLSKSNNLAATWLVTRKSANDNVSNINWIKYQMAANNKDDNSKWLIKDVKDKSAADDLLVTITAGRLKNILIKL
jgi:hypothetical protein